MEDLDVLRDLMPQEGIAHLFMDNGCKFCKADPPNVRDGYALLDMGHKEPARMKRSALFIKTKARIGSMLPVQISTCADCRKRFQRLEYLPILMPLGVAVLMMILLSIPAIVDPLTRIHMIMSFAIFAGAVIVSVLLGKIIQKNMRKKYARVMRLDPFEIPTLHNMRQNGWFLLGANGKLIFTKKRMRMGVGTGAPEDAFVAQHTS
jgi:hypothetical protein